MKFRSDGPRTGGLMERPFSCREDAEQALERFASTLKASLVEPTGVFEPPGEPA